MGSYIQLLSNIGLRYIQSIPKMSSKTIKTKSGIQINPFASLNDLLDGTSFQQDKVTQGHLESLGGAFHEISKTDEGQVLLTQWKDWPRGSRPMSASKTQ